MRDKAFNTTFAGTLGEGRVAGQALDVLIASDDADAKETVSGIVGDAGLSAIDAGPLVRAHSLKPSATFTWRCKDPLGTSFSSAVKVLP